MSRFISIVSGKGGVGKTTTALNLGVALSKFGSSAAVVDASFHTPNIGIHLGSPKLPNSIHDVLNGDAHATAALHFHPSGIHVMTGLISHNSHKLANLDGFRNIITGLDGHSDFVLLDCSPGLGEDIEESMKASNEAIIVTNPDMAAVTDAMRAMRVAKENGVRIVGAVINRTRNDSVELTRNNIERLLETQVLASVPEDDNVRLSQRLRHPVIHSHPTSPASIAYKKAAAVILDQDYSP